MKSIKELESCKDCKHPKWYHRCCYCRTELNIDNTVVKNGKCRICSNESSKKSELKHRKERTIRRKERYLANPELHKEKTKSYREKRKITTLKAYGGENPSCVCCGETIIDFLCLDHINNDGKIDREKYGSGSAFYDKLKKLSYPKHLQILCFNCNMAKEFKGECPHNLYKLKSGKELLSFTTYLRLNKELRFWQALRNWTALSDRKANFILTAEDLNLQTGQFEGIKDTFYIE